MLSRSQQVFALVYKDIQRLDLDFSKWELPREYLFDHRKL